MDIIKNTFRILLRIRRIVQIRYYCRLQPKILERVRSQKKIKIVFFLSNLSQWKYESLFSLLLANDRYDPIIIPFFYPHYQKAEQHKIESDIVTYCINKKFPYLLGYNIDDGKYIDASILAPDIVIYTQPYNHGYHFWKIKKFWKYALFIYTPYGICIEKAAHFYDTLLQNIAVLNFYPNEYFKQLFKQSVYVKDRNIAIVGNPICDAMTFVQEQDNPWKLPNSYKKVIWAPHHTILKSDFLQYSNFIEVADDMIELAKKYKDQVEFIFKPHPRLLNKLYAVWGIEKANEYYRQWNMMPNTSILLGEYNALFWHSDAMIHDCSSFTVEYLYSGHPVMYLSKEGHENYLNDYGKQCFNVHYQGRTIQDVESFIVSVVLNDNDPLKAERDKVYLKELCSPNDKSVGENMFDYVQKLFI